MAVHVRSLVEILAIFLMFGCTLLVYKLWWIAFFGGGEVLVQINATGELWVEYALWFILTPVITVGFYLYLHGEGRESVG